MLNIALIVLIVAVVVLLYLSVGEYRKKSSSAASEISSIGAKTPWLEKREDSRVKVKWPVTIETDEGPLNGELINVSLGGAFICCKELSRSKETFRLTINPPNHQAISATVSVTWSNLNVPESEVVNRGIGIRFLGISEEDRRFISEVVADSSEPA